LTNRKPNTPSLGGFLERYLKAVKSRREPARADPAFESRTGLQAGTPFSWSAANSTR
jgi:hypothetical protein